MKIHGVDGLSPEIIRDEVNRGGRFVIYTYCVSVLIMTFKRPTDVYLVKAGRSAAAASWPYLLVSFLFGWWGFPWGPIYTVQSIYQNLCGGIDVTDDIMHQILPAVRASAPAATPPPTLQQTTPAGTPPRPGGFNLRVAILMLAAVCVAVLLGMSGYCFYKTQTLTVVLASGLDRPYSVVLNGETHTLAPNSEEILTMPEGEFTLEDVPGSDVVGGRQTFDFSRPFFDHLGSENVAVINPDRVAVLLDSEVPYYKDGTPIPEDEVPGFEIFVSQISYSIPKPDYVIVDAAKHIDDMPSGTIRLVKHRLSHVADPDLASIFNVLNERRGHPAVRDYIMLLGKHRTDDVFLSAALSTLKPEEIEAFFQLHLAERPVQVEWHRYYQTWRTMNSPDDDIVAEYRAYLQAEPGDGALCYLLGRQVADRAEQSELWKKALNAETPCFYAYNALGFDAMAEGRFEEALAYYDESIKAGVSNRGLVLHRRETLLATGKIPELLAEIADEEKAKPFDLALVEEQMIATYAAGSDIGEAVKLKGAYLARYKAVHPPAEYLADAEAFLEATIAYLEGDMPTYAANVSRFQGPFYQFRSAMASGDPAAATTLLAESKHGDADAQLLLYLLILRSGDTQAAEPYFIAAHDVMSKRGAYYDQVANALTAERPDPGVICAAHIDIDSKRILLTALGVRYPDDRDVYFAAARKFDFNPQFPHQFLQSFLKE